MGSLFSRHNEGVESIESAANNAYRFPPAQGKGGSSCESVSHIVLLERSRRLGVLYPSALGKYFADYFILGGTKFDTPQPEAYLFGENNDLNLFSQKPVAVSYFPEHTCSFSFLSVFKCCKAIMYA